MKTVVRMLSTFFYLGYLPVIPGTVGSLGALFFYLMVRDNTVLYAGSIIVLTIMGLLVVRKAEEIFGRKDAGAIVIDEAVGMMLTFFLVPKKPVLLFCGFLFFRFFDIVKPFPIRRLEKIRSPWGVMLDDVAAGIYANLAVWAVYILVLKRGI